MKFIFCSSLIRKPNLSLLQLIQIVINTVHLEETNINLENFISGELDMKQLVQSDVSLSRVHRSRSGRDSRCEAAGEVNVQGHQSGGRGVHLQEAGNTDRGGLPGQFII